MKTSSRGACGIVTALLALGVVGCSSGGKSSVKEAPTGDNLPSWFGLESSVYDTVPTEGHVKMIPWAGTYWPTFAGGISNRWQEPVESLDYQNYLYKLATAQEIEALSAEQIAKLSPTEKYDIWQGRTDLAAQTAATGAQRAFVQRKATQSGGEIPTWTGICNGWSTAAINEDQPMKPVTVTNARNQQIVFYPGDLTALMSQIYFDYQSKIQVRRLGSMCRQSPIVKDEDGRPTDPDCRDINPMSFHLALGGFLAKGKAFVVDQFKADQVWNQPVYGYELKYSNLRPIDANYKHAAQGTVQLVDVDAVLKFVVEASPQKDAGFTQDQLRQQFLEGRPYSYTLELTADGHVIGGEWRGPSSPDFIWYPTVTPTDEILGSSYPMAYSKVKELFGLSKQ